MKRILYALALALLVVASTQAEEQESMFPISEIERILAETRDACPTAWRNAHRMVNGQYEPTSWDFMIYAVRRLQAATPYVGGNWRRGRVGDLSMDGVTIKATNNRYYFADVIGGAGGDNPRLTFNVTGEAPEIGFVDVNELPQPVGPCSGSTGGGGGGSTGGNVDAAVKTLLEAIAQLKNELAHVRSLVEQAHTKLDATGSNDAQVRDLLSTIQDRLESRPSGVAEAQILEFACSKNSKQNCPDYTAKAGPITIISRPR